MELDTAGHDGNICTCIFHGRQHLSLFVRQWVQGDPSCLYLGRVIHTYRDTAACFIDVRKFQGKGCGLFFCRIPFHMGGAEHACLREALAFWHCGLGNIRSGEPLHPGKDTGGESGKIS